MNVNYFLEISQVDYLDRTSQQAIENNGVLETYNYRSQQTIQTIMGMPAVFFRYELSPIRIQYTMEMQTLTQFIIRVCAVIGGVYCVSSMSESLIRNSFSLFEIGDGTQKRKSPMKRVVRKKIETNEVELKDESGQQGINVN